MELSFGAIVMGMMVLLRIVVPILVMVLVVWALRRLNARWDAEAQQEVAPRKERPSRQRSAAPILDRKKPVGELPR